MTPTWRIIPFSKWLVTPIYKPFRPFGKRILTNVINHLLNGMILQVWPRWDGFFLFSLGDVQHSPMGIVDYLAGGNSNIFGIFTPTWGNDSFWLIFFKWVEITNQLCSIWELFMVKSCVHQWSSMAWYLGFTSSVEINTPPFTQIGQHTGFHGSPIQMVETYMVNIW